MSAWRAERSRGGRGATSDPAFWTIVALAGVWRVAYVLVGKRDEALVGDQIYYSGQARAIALGRWFEHPHRAGEYAADHAPMTSLLLAPFSFPDDPVLVQRLVMAVAGTAVVAACGALTWRLAGRRAGLAATVIAAVYANLWMNDVLIMSETFSAGAVVAVLWWCYRTRATGALRDVAVLGAVVGLAGLVRAELLLLGPVVALPMVLGGVRRHRDDEGRGVGHEGGHRDRQTTGARRMTAAVVLAAAAIAAVAPWMVRNAVRFEDRTLISTQEGLTLMGANCDDTYRGGGIGFWSLGCALAVPMPDGLDQSQVSSRYRDEAAAYVRANLDRVPLVVAARLGRGFSLWNVEGMSALNQGEGRARWASELGAAQFWLLVPLAGLGVLRWPPGRDVPRWPLLALGLLSFLVIAAFYGIPRFRLPLEVALVIAGGIGVDVLARLRRNVPAGAQPSVAP